MSLSKKTYQRNPYILFLPFLILYVILVFIFPTSGTTGDESRYLIYARYMIDGFIPASETGFDTLGNGPGYSIVLIPFVYLNLPVICITLLNAILFYLSIVLIYKALMRFTTSLFAIILSCFWGLFFNMYENMVSLIPETITAFLISLLSYVLIKNENPALPKWKFLQKIILPAFILTFIALTKPIFGYVILTLAMLLLVIFIVFKNHEIKILLSITLFSLIFALPYLTYTYLKTGKIFYWSSVGGNNLYWISTPYENEYGNWYPNPNKEDFYSNDDTTFFSVREKLLKNHGENFKQLEKLSGQEQDDLYKNIALHNILSHPKKFLLNCFSNIGRMLFNFPYSYSFQSPNTLLRLPQTGFLLCSLILSLVPAWMNWKLVPKPLGFLLLLSIIYLGGSIFGSAEIRMFSVIVPIFLIWIGYIFQKTVILELKWKKKTGICE